MNALNNTFWKRSYCDSKGHPSSNRVHMGVILWPTGFFVAALGIRTLIDGRVPDVPTGTGIFFGVVQAIVGLIRGVQTYLENKSAALGQPATPAAPAPV